MIDPKERYVLHVDGASRGNPGQAGAGGLIRSPDGAVIAEIRRFLGTQTNNYAEYAAAWLTLRKAFDLGIRRVHLHGDSKLVIEQLAGNWKVKHPGLRKAHEECRALMAQFDEVLLTHVLREYNREADTLSNEAIDQRTTAASP